MRRGGGLRDAARRRVLGWAARLAAAGWLLPWLPAAGGEPRLSRHEAAFFRRGTGTGERS